MANERADDDLEANDETRTEISRAGSVFLSFQGFTFICFRAEDFFLDEIAEIETS
mgnify:CR=1 FL=1